MKDVRKMLIKYLDKYLIKNSRKRKVQFLLMKK